MNKEWKIVKLGDYISIKSGLAYKGSKIGKGNSLLLGMGCVSFKDVFVYNGARSYEGDEVDESFCVSPGDIVLATRQQSDNMPILAMPAIIPSEFKNKKVIFGTNLYKVENHSEISNRFLFWLFKHQHYVSYIAGVKSGTAVQMVTKKNVEKYKFLCPPLEERERIADILWAYQNHIDLNDNRINTLERIIENIYKEWFIRFRFPGSQKVYKNNELPEEWEYKRADEAIEFNPSLGLNNQKAFTIIPMEALSTNSMVLDRSCFDSKEKITGRRSQNGDTLMAKITPCLENGKTGYVMSLEEGEVAGGSTEFIVLRSKTLNPYYVYCLARSDYFRQIAIMSMNGADGRQRVDEDKLKSTKIIQPSKRVLDQFETIIGPIFKEISVLVLEKDNLIRQRDLLLPRLLSGKLRV